MPFEMSKLLLEEINKYPLESGLPLQSVTVPVIVVFKVLSVKDTSTEESVENGPKVYS